MKSKEKEVKKVFKTISIMDYKVLEQHYQAMAAKGWLLSDVKGA